MYVDDFKIVQGEHLLKKYQSPRAYLFLLRIKQNGLDRRRFATVCRTTLIEETQNKTILQNQ